MNGSRDDAPPSTVVVTGASGVVGRGIAAELRRRRHHVVGLVHSDTTVPEAHEVVRVDITAPGLGLREEQWTDLAARADAVVHSAALTTWGLPRQQYQAVNVDGTRRVVALAAAADAPVFLISTAFLLALDSPVFEDVVRPGNVVRPYIWSKREAERIVRASGVPYTIFRPTNLVGDSRTGASIRPQIVQLISDWIVRGKAPYFPAHPGNLVDVVPLDAVARAVAGAIEHKELGSEHWLTYGEAAMTVEEGLRGLVEHAAARGRTIPVAAVVDPREPLPVPLERVPSLSRAFLEVIIDVSEVTHACGGVLPTSLPELQRRYDLPTVSCEGAFRRSLAYWSGQRGLRAGSEGP